MTTYLLPITPVLCVLLYVSPQPLPLWFSLGFTHLFILFNICFPHQNVSSKKAGSLFCSTLFSLEQHLPCGRHSLISCRINGWMNEKEKLIMTLGSRENNEDESFYLGVEGWAELDSQAFWGETSQVERIFCAKPSPLMLLEKQSPSWLVPGPSGSSKDGQINSWVENEERGLPVEWGNRWLITACVERASKLRVGISDKQFALSL